MIFVDQGKLLHGIASPLDAMVGICDGPARQDRCICGLDNVTLNAGIVFFESGSTASEGTACAGVIAECIDLSLRLFQDFRSSMQVMGPRAAFQMKLIRTEGIALLRDPLRGFFHQRQIPTGNLTRFRIGQLIDENDFGAEGFIIRARSVELPFDITATKG
jgi:hypothetical protein